MKTCGKNKQRYNCIEWRNHEARRVKEYILITLATIPYAIGIALFLDPNDDVIRGYDPADEDRGE